MRGIKVIAFDFDKTLYANVKFDDFEGYCAKGFTQICGWTDEYGRDMLMSWGSVADNVIIEKLQELGYDKNDWLSYRHNNRPIIDCNGALHFPSAILASLVENCDLYIVTNNVIEDVLMVSKGVGLDLKRFKGILCNDYTEISKKHLYKRLIDVENIEPSEMLVVGDKYATDVLPGLELGCKGKVLKCQELYRLLSNGRACE